MALLGDYQVFTNVTGTLVTASASPGIVMVGENPQRKSLQVFNDSPNILFLKFAQKRSGSFAAPVVTSKDYNVIVAANSLYSSPAPAPTGSILGVWGAASGSGVVTEIS